MISLLTGKSTISPEYKFGTAEPRRMLKITYKYDARFICISGIYAHDSGNIPSVYRY